MLYLTVHGLYIFIQWVEKYPVDVIPGLSRAFFDINSFWICSCWDLTTLANETKWILAIGIQINIGSSVSGGNRSLNEIQKDLNTCFLLGIVLSYFKKEYQHQRSIQILFFQKRSFLYLMYLKFPHSIPLI